LAVVQCGVTPEGALDEVIKLPARIVTACTFGGPHLDQLSALLRRRITAGGQAELMRRRPAQVPTPRSGFAGFRFPSEVIMVAVRWYLRYGLSYRDVEELLAERGIAVDHVTIYRWVQRFTPLLIEAARPCRHASGDRWFVDETYVKVAGRWVYLYRAIDQFGRHCCIKAKGVLASHQSGESAPSGTLKNQDNRAFEGLLRGFVTGNWIRSGEPIA
jgi:hypothetical protein